MRSYEPMDGWMDLEQGKRKIDLSGLPPHLRPFFSITLGQRRKEVASLLSLLGRNRLNFDREASYENFSSYPRSISYLIFEFRMARLTDTILSISSMEMIFV